MNENLYVYAKTDVLPQAMLIHSAHILSRSADELRDLIDHTVTENPLLEYDDDGCNLREDAPIFEAAERISLRDHLLSQLRLARCEKELLPLCEHLIGCIDDDGYMRDDLSELSLEWNVSEERLQGALKIVQSLEPCGVGAQSLQECLKLQLRDLPDASVELQIVEKNLEALAGGTLDMPEIAPDRLEAAIARIRSLEPHPGAAFDARPIKYLLPDLEITYEKNVLTVGLANQPVVPRITPLYKEWLQGGSELQRRYAQDCLTGARELLFAIEQRAHTLLSVAELAARRQQTFFASGKNADLLPLTMTETASALGLSLSTVSRAVLDKHYAYRGKLFPLRKLFLRDGIGERNRLWVAQRMGELAGQSPDRLSDERMAELLRAEGIAISRRTVNKYRRELSGKTKG